MKAEDVYASERVSGNIVRYHTWPTIQRQTNADHTLHVLRIFMIITTGADSNFHWPTLLPSIIYHDFGENGVGDIPYPAKKDNPSLKMACDISEEISLNRQGICLVPLDPVMKTMVKIADLLEMAEFAVHEIRMGNTFAHPVRDRTLSHVESLLLVVTNLIVERNITKFMEGLNV